jgi:hypothetical protein
VENAVTQAIDIIPDLMIVPVVREKHGEKQVVTIIWCVEHALTEWWNISNDFVPVTLDIISQITNVFVVMRIHINLGLVMPYLAVQHVPQTVYHLPHQQLSQAVHAILGIIRMVIIATRVVPVKLENIQLLHVARVLLSVKTALQQVLHQADLLV